MDSNNSRTHGDTPIRYGEIKPSTPGPLGRRMSMVENQVFQLSPPLT